MTLAATITPAELLHKIEAESSRPIDESNLRIYDATVEFQRGPDGSFVSVPGREAYADGHIPQSRFVDHQAELSEPDSPHGFTLLGRGDLELALRNLGVDNDSSVVVYSGAHVMWATRLWWILRSCGVEDVSVLDGGFEGWKRAGFPTVQGEDSYPIGGLEIDRDGSFWASKTEVEESIGRGTVCTINALTREVHDGTSAIHYGRPGHIPESVNVPFDELVVKGQFLPVSQLREHFDRVGAFDKERVVTYCGGGIAATLAGFVLRQLQHSNVGVYDGSLSEWSADDSLPIRTSADD